MKYYVYILKSKIPHRYYVGLTKNLERRLAEHNNRKKHWTSKFQPWEIIHCEEFSTPTEAMKRERWLKSKDGIAEKLRIINKD